MPCGSSIARGPQDSLCVTNEAIHSHKSTADKSTGEGIARDARRPLAGRHHVEENIRLLDGDDQLIRRTRIGGVSTHGVTSTVWAMVMKSSMTAGKTMLGHVHVAVHRERCGEPGPACGARVIHVS